MEYEMDEKKNKSNLEKKGDYIMAIVRMTLEEIKKSITPEMRERARIASTREPILTDPDAFEVSDAMVPFAYRPGNQDGSHRKIKQNILFDIDVFEGLKKLGCDWSKMVNDEMRLYLLRMGAL